MEHKCVKEHQWGVMETSIKELKEDVSATKTLLEKFYNSIFGPSTDGDKIYSMVLKNTKHRVDFEKEEAKWKDRLKTAALSLLSALIVAITVYVFMTP